MAKPADRPGKRVSVDRDFPVVGIGCSAGGLDALEKFFARVPQDSGMAFVVVQHLSPDYTSALPELLQRIATIAVTEAVEAVKIRPNHVYTIPPSKDLSILHGTLTLLDPVEPHGHRLAIDCFFRSLAEERQAKAIGVILSGMGSDGMFGLRAIKEKGGLTLVQDPSTALADSMPRSAIDAGVADIIASPEDLPSSIATYLNHPLHTSGRSASSESSVETDLDKIVVLLRDRTGNDFSLYKSNTLVRRIERRMALHQIAETGEYIRYLRQNSHELDLLFRELLIGVTRFFRDAEVWERVRDVMLPRLIKKHPAGRAIRAWIPACSSGEEAYSLAIVFSEAMAALKPEGHFTLQIYGTDLDPDAIDRARTGIYPRNIAADISPTRLARYFTEDAGGYRINMNIREMVVFAVQNVIADPPFTKLDFLSCRNLLIYFRPQLQKRILPVFNYALNGDGVLLLGSSETVGAASDLFTPLDNKSRLFRRLGPPPSLPPIDFPSRTPRGLRRTSETAVTDDSMNIGALTDRLILQTYAAPAVLVNEDGDILYISGRTGRYLEPAAGKVNMNLHAMAREGIRQALPGVIRRALSHAQPIHLNGLRVDANGGGDLAVVDLVVEAIQEPEALRGRVIVVFNPVSQPPVTKRGKKAEANAAHESLLQELQQSREALQVAQEEMQTSMEELKSTNEELQSTNEELQSTNEELSTSKEEMQSMNEELQTVNSELQSKIRDLTWAQNDMSALLDSTEIATVFLDTDMKLRRFTQHATKLFNLIPTDIGRPLSDVTSSLHYPQFQEHALEVLRTLAFREERVEAAANQWFRVRIMPYRTQDNVIDGVVATFLDITEIHQLEDRLHRSTSTSTEENDS